MAVSFFFRSVRIPSHMEDFTLHRISLFIIYFDFICGHDDHFAVFDQINFFAVFHQCRNIGSNEILAFADSCNQRCIFTDRNDFVRVFARHDNKCIRPSHFESCCINRILKLRIVFHVSSNQMRDDFTVGFRLKFYIVFCNEHLLQFHEVFKDAVVDNCDCTVFTRMRMRIYIRRCAVRRPPGVPDSRMAVKTYASCHLVFQKLLKVCNFSNLFSDIDSAVSYKRNSCGIISPVFQLFKAIHNDGSRIVFSYISYNTAHNFYLLNFFSIKAARSSAKRRIISVSFPSSITRTRGSVPDGRIKTLPFPSICASIAAIASATSSSFI